MNEKVTKKDPIFQKKIACGGHFYTHKFELTCNSRLSARPVARGAPRYFVWNQGVCVQNKTYLAEQFLKNKAAE